MGGDQPVSAPRLQARKPRQRVSGVPASPAAVAFPPLLAPARARTGLPVGPSMSSRKPSPGRRSDGLTGDLFAIPRPAAPIPASMDFRAEVSHLMGDMLARAHAGGLDRWEVASRASRLAGRDVSKNMLDGYTAESREEFNVPLWVSPVLEIVCSSTALSEWHGAKVGGQLVVGEATIDAEIGRLEAERDRAAQKIRGLKSLRRVR